MNQYVIGDVQGCFDDLMDLLDAIDFNPSCDRLYFCGDLVNRGGQSLEVLRWVYAHQFCCQTVLGNHDLSLLARYYIDTMAASSKEQRKVFNAPDVSILMKWLIKQPLLIELKDDIIVHAGIYPLWTIQQAKEQANAVHSMIKKKPKKFLKLMFGSRPDHWDENLDDVSLMRFVINALTRMRFIGKDGKLDFEQNGSPEKASNLIPWYLYPERKAIPKHIIFGHWSALGYYSNDFCTCLDSGKVWGGKLTALCLNDRKTHQI